MARARESVHYSEIVVPRSEGPGPPFICSIDFVARNDEIRERMRDTHWDLVVVDEAHKMATYRYGTKTRTTARYDLGAFLAERTDHFLFLTGTPHKGDPDNSALG